MTRACGPCTACCTAIHVKGPELQKAMGERCVHLVCNGCGIYDHKPQACTTFCCDWLRGAWGSDDDRPDISGVIVEDTPDGVALSCAPGFSIDDYGPRLAESFFLEAGRDNIQLWDSERGRMTAGDRRIEVRITSSTADSLTIVPLLHEDKQHG